MNYTVQIRKDFDKALEDIISAAEKRTFRVQHIHRVSDILNEKGFEIEKYAIVEICNPKFAHVVLSADKNFGSILPCKVLLYEKEAKVYVSIPKPIDLVEKLGMDEVKEIAVQVDRIMREIIDEVEK